ncbi:helix-turn-helix transcriptional regulator [Rossellomorea vietnamensis]|uniref:Helix-turn-helix transcriptional regulator n=1 Tax=Rossellomorea vietnamensis TaxID=218284 RepID=A0A5D4NFE7_9BACI|nr:helix-turn-helix transcriptional regulator [Rossellomorea vietnamensis]TYS12983.1 helix-turn-helix transcriptional regulator [Rossellomorea vietnamensis]
MVDKEHDISEFIEIPSEYKVINLPKQKISEAVRLGLKEKKLSLRKAADKVEGMSYPQISRITSGENYNIDTLLKILNILDLEIEIKKKTL